MWDGASENKISIQGHGGGVNSVAWSPDGSRLAVGLEDGAVRVWSDFRMPSDGSDWLHTGFLVELYQGGGIYKRRALDAAIAQDDATMKRIDTNS